MPLGLLSPIFPVQDKKLSGCLQVFFLRNKLQKNSRILDFGSTVVSTQACLSQQLDQVKALILQDLLLGQYIHDLFLYIVLLGQLVASKYLCCHFTLILLLEFSQAG